MRVNAAVSMLRGGRTASGVLVQVEGHGTLNESPALREFAVQSLEAQFGTSTLVIDLSNCDYLDSTFLGCLAGLHRMYNRAVPHRFVVAASYDKSQKLLGPTRLNQVLDVTDVYPEPIGETVELTGPLLFTADLGRHIMECHRLLAELGGSRAASFQSIADQLSLELGEAPIHGDPPTDDLENHSR
jgi:anti-anti-sigma factor